ncbi:hypothetical protein [Saccharopolyspora phatthalungensis]|nr:hypothetical protein [Saccharopolyspora phatthalungensis]
MVDVPVTADLPIRVRALSVADLVEIRFGKAFPVSLPADRAALCTLGSMPGIRTDELTADERSERA